MKYFWIISLFIVFVCVLAACDNDTEYQAKVTVDKISLNDSIKIRKIDFVDDYNGLLCGGTRKSNGSIYITKDGGNSWTKTYHSDSLSVNSFYYLDDSIVFACGDSLMILKSYDGGQNWGLIELGNYPYEEYFVPYNDIYANSEQNIFIVGGEHFYKGIWSETETGNYPWTHDTYDNEIASICFLTEYIGFFGGYGFMFVTEDGGNTFDYIDFEDEFFVDIEADDHGNVYAVSDIGILHYTSDLGYNWSRLIDDYNAEFTDLSLGKETSAICGYNGLVYLRNSGNGSWLKTKDVPNVNFYSVCVNDRNEIFLGSDKGEVYILNKRRNI